MKVEFVKQHPDFAYGPGDVAERPEQEALALIEAGYAVQAKTKSKEIETADSPDEPELAVSKKGKKA